MHGFETVKQELDAKRHQLEHELQSAQGKVAEIHADLERVQEALQALVGTRKKGKGRARSGKKPGATVHDLQAHIAKVRAEHPYASAHELQKSVRALVKASGVSLTGFPRLFAEALVSSPGFSGSVEHPASLTAGLHPHHGDDSGAHEHALHVAEHAHHEHAEHGHAEASAEDVPSAESEDGPFIA